MRRLRGQRPRFRQQQHDRGPGESGQERSVTVPVIVQPDHPEFASSAEHRVLEKPWRQPQQEELLDDVGQQPTEEQLVRSAGDVLRQRQNVLVLDQATILLHSAHHNGDPPVAAEEINVERDLRVHHVAVPLLPRQVPSLAELHQTQPVPQRLFHQNTARAREPGQGQLLDAGPAGRGHVRQRELPASQEEIQEAPAALRAPRQGDHGDLRHLRRSRTLPRRRWRSSRCSHLPERRVPVSAARFAPARLLPVDLGGTEARRLPGAAATVVQTGADHGTADSTDRPGADEDHDDTQQPSADRQEEELQHRRADRQTGGERSELRRPAGSQPVGAQGDQESGVGFLSSRLEDPPDGCLNPRISQFGVSIFQVGIFNVSKKVGEDLRATDWDEREDWFDTGFFFFFFFLFTRFGRNVGDDEVI